MTPDKIEACIDWLMFLAAPQNSGPMVNDLGSFLPTVKGTKPLESLAPLISSMQNTEKQGGACELSGEEGDAYYRLIQEFMANRTSLGDTMQKVTPVIQAAVDKQARENKWDLSKYKR